MHVIKFNLKHGSVFVDSVSIAIDERGVLARPIAKLCSLPIQTDEGRMQYRLLTKASVCGKSADGVIEVAEGRVRAITFLFDLIEFFESGILESKVLKTFEKSLKLNLISNHPTSAFLEPCEWGQAIFFMMPSKAT